MEKDIPPEEVRFGKVLCEVIDIVYNVVLALKMSGYDSVANPTILELVKNIVAEFDKVVLIEGFISRSYTKWNALKDDTREFFIRETNLFFDGLPVENVGIFSQLFSLKDEAGNYVISQEKEEEIRDFFTALIRISIKYIHRKRKPTSRVDENGNLVCKYNNRYMDEVDLNDLAEKW